MALRSQESLKDRKGDAAHCAVLPALFADADFKHLGEEETRRRIKDCPLSPSMIVESGGGLHVYWVLRQPFYLRKEMAEAKRWLRHIAASVADVVDEEVSETGTCAAHSRVKKLEGRIWRTTSGDPAVIAPRTYSIDELTTAFGEPAAAPEKVNGSGFNVPETIRRATAIHSSTNFSVHRKRATYRST